MGLEPMEIVGHGRRQRAMGASLVFAALTLMMVAPSALGQPSPSSEVDGDRVETMRVARSLENLSRGFRFQPRLTAIAQSPPRQSTERSGPAPTRHESSQELEEAPVSGAVARESSSSDHSPTHFRNPKIH